MKQKICRNNKRYLQMIFFYQIIDYIYNQININLKFLKMNLFKMLFMFLIFTVSFTASATPTLEKKENPIIEMVQTNIEAVSVEVVEVFTFDFNGQTL